MNPLFAIADFEFSRRILIFLCKWKVGRSLKRGTDDLMAPICLRKRWRCSVLINIIEWIRLTKPGRGRLTSCPIFGLHQATWTTTVFGGSATFLKLSYYIVGTSGEYLVTAIMKTRVDSW